jgi:hypothetical protein
MSDDIRNPLLSVIKIGTKGNEAVRKEIFVEKSVKFSSAIHWANQRTFLSIHKHEKESKGRSSGRKEGKCSNEALNCS